MAELQRVKTSTIRRILAGDADALGNVGVYGFAWVSTPQSWHFWNDEFDRLRNGQCLSPAARAYLENLLANGRRVRERNYVLDLTGGPVREITK